MKWILCLLLLPSWALAEDTLGRDAFIVAGMGGGRGLPATIRVGYHDWEGGLLMGGVIGMQEIFRDKWHYVSFGPAILGLYGSTGFGFAAGAGIECMLFWRISFRVELTAAAGSNGFATSAGFLGLGLHF